MKTKQFLIATSLLASIALGAPSCSMKEYNPSGTTADVIFSTKEGIETLVNGTYFNFRWKFFGREDPVLYLDGGTDLWFNAELGTYGRQLTQYDGLVSTTGQIANVWNRLYDNVNLCNSGITRIQEVYYQNPAEKKYREGEMRVMRAISYWWLVEFFGNIDMRTTETASPELRIYRTPAAKIYDEVIIPDLQKACELLLADPIDGMVGRITLKSAYGFLARIALTRAAYGDAPKYNQMALDAAKYAIENKAALKVDLYSKYDDVFDPKNNKTNKEAMFVTTHSTITTQNPNAGNPNRLFCYYNPRYANFIGCQLSLEHGPDGQNPKMMPTKYLLKLYDQYDARYAASFDEVFYCNTPAGYTWTAAHQALFKKPASFVNTVKVNNGDTALFYTRNSISEEVKSTARYAIVDVDMVYDKVDGKILTSPDQYSRFFPKLKKFKDPDRPAANSQVGTKDVIVMRLAEMYLIAAEAEIALGRPANAVPYIQTLRQRATVPGHEAAMAVGTADMTLNFILEERARELCGENIRWFDLKRTKKLVTNINAYNKNITLVREFHNLRPIPETFLTTILNREEFSQNFGY